MDITPEDITAGFLVDFTVKDMSRPSTYSPELAAEICGRLANGEPLAKICREEAMPAPSSVYLWLTQHKDFSDMYARAREDQADTMADEIVRIADEAEDPAKGRLQVDARKWVAAKLKPRKYGDKVTNEHSGPDGAAIPVSVTVNFR
jgi:hypothetical protein